MAEKIVILETKVTENESTDSIKAQGASAIMKTPEDVNIKKDKTENPKEKKTKEKVSVLNLGQKLKKLSQKKYTQKKLKNQQTFLTVNIVTTTVRNFLH